MENECFKPTEEWPLQEGSKRGLHEQLQSWGKRVVPLIDTLPEEERVAKARFLEYLVKSVIRGDRLTAQTVSAVDGYVRDYVEGPGPYGRGGGSIESIVGYTMCQRQFEGLYGIYQAGVTDARNE